MTASTETMGDLVEGVLEHVVSIEDMLDGYWIEQRPNDCWLHHGRTRDGSERRAVLLIQPGTDLRVIFAAAIADHIAQEIMTPLPEGGV